jgi:hypothetical protein
MFCQYASWAGSPIILSPVVEPAQTRRNGGNMKTFGVGRALALVLVTLSMSLAPKGIGAQGTSQYPIADKIADKLIQKYQTSSCQQLAAEKQQPPTAQKEEMEQKVVQTLHQDPQLRQHFLNRVAAPIVNKLFDCGFIP